MVFEDKNEIHDLSKICDTISRNKDKIIVSWSMNADQDHGNNTSLVK